MVTGEGAALQNWSLAISSNFRFLLTRRSLTFAPSKDGFSIEFPYDDQIAAQSACNALISFVRPRGFEPLQRDNQQDEERPSSLSRYKPLTSMIRKFWLFGNTDLLVATWSPHGFWRVF
jgi:hypothetical protein